jgi:hypothetical protein
MTTSWSTRNPCWRIWATRCTGGCRWVAALSWHRLGVRELGTAQSVDLDEPRIRDYCDNVKNITVSVDDEVYHKARVKAAELRTTVSALVRKMLVDVAGQETEFEGLRREERELRARLRARGVPLRAGDRVSRDELHDRHALR